MTTKDEALKMALDALEFSKSYLDDLADVHGTSKKAKPGSTSWHVDRAITACRAALAQKDCECFAIALDAANRTKEACIKATGQKKNIETYVNAIQIAHDAAGTDFDACREALAHKDEQEPIARVTGYFNGMCVVEPLDKAAVLPVGAAIYASQQIDKRVKVKLGGQYGFFLDGNWFYLQPADEFANAALYKHTGVDP